MALSPGSSRPPLSHTLAIAVRWPVGMVAMTWRYLRRTQPIHRTTGPGDAGDLPEPIPANLAGPGLQRLEDGVGPVLHRRYRVLVAEPRVGAAAMMARFGDDPNHGAPADAAVFVKRSGPSRSPAPGDEYTVRIPGPWDGPIRVVGLTPTSLRFATLDGHLEAGQIEFRATDEAGALRIEIESWARAGDRMSDVLYNRLHLAKEVQLNLWVETLLRLAADTGGRITDGVHVDTREVAAPAVT